MLCVVKRGEKLMNKIDLPVLYERKEECCGCTACYAICPNDAIVWLKMKRALNIRRLMKASVCGAVNAVRYVR